MGQSLSAYFGLFLFIASSFLLHISLLVCPYSRYCGVKQMHILSVLPETHTYSDLSVDHICAGVYKQIVHFPYLR
jgi:hypothetical protein